MIDIKAKREARLEELHPVFREFDALVGGQIEIAREDPKISDDDIICRLLDGGTEESIALSCATFIPLVFGRVIVAELGVTVADTFVEYNRATRTTQELPLGNEVTFVWAKNVIDLYRQSPEYNPAFQSIATRSAELSAVNNALNDGIDQETLRESTIDPPLIHVGKPKPWWQFWK